MSAKEVCNVILNNLTDDDFKNVGNRIYPDVWISCKISLPENYEYVLTYLESSTKTIRVNWYSTLLQRWHEGDDGITHWMPLPEPPNEPA